MIDHKFQCAIVIATNRILHEQNHPTAVIDVSVKLKSDGGDLLNSTASTTAVGGCYLNGAASGTAGYATAVRSGSYAAAFCPGYSTGSPNSACGVNSFLSSAAQQVTVSKLVQAGTKKAKEEFDFFFIHCLLKAIGPMRACVRPACRRGVLVSRSLKIDNCGIRSAELLLHCVAGQR